HHRVLPSFPTRRSSDLFGAVDLAIAAIVEPLVGDDPVDVRVGAREQSRVARARYRGRVVVPAIHEIGPAQQQVETPSDKVGPEADRKSTRLNSSHQIIS